MHWKIKAAVQNAVSLLPTSLSYSAYYQIQRRFGGWRQVDPTKRLTAGITTWRHILSQGQNPAGKVFFEVGTGRMPLVPLAYWLMGAERTITVDLNPYLQRELISEAVSYIAHHQANVTDRFGALLDPARFDQLMSFAAKPNLSVAEFLDLCRVQYMAPADAAHTGLHKDCVDFHTSYTVLEHIPGPTLHAIITEGSRITRPQGLFVHMIDYSDHFSHSDRSISAINFLQYSDREWQKYASNRYMYMNRLRHDDVLGVFSACGHRVLHVQPEIDERVRDLLRSGQLRLAEPFRAKPQDVLAVTAAWVISQKASG